jgi:hypothetical protein
MPFFMIQSYFYAMNKKNLLLWVGLLTNMLATLAQNQTTKNDYAVAIDQYYDGGNIYVDTVWIALRTDSKTVPRMPTRRVSYANGFYRNIRYDSIHYQAVVQINDVWFSDKKYIQKLPSYRILSNRSDTAQYYIVGKEERTKVKLLGLSTMVMQKHPDFPSDFFAVKPYSLESIRYRCAAEQPIFDVFSSTSETVFDVPRYLVNGKLQALKFDIRSIPFNDIVSINVFSPKDAMRFFSIRFKKGLVSIKTKQSHQQKELAFKIRVLEETQQNQGNWIVTADTLLDDMESFSSYRLAKITQQNMPVYLIDGNFETEYINRKSINLDHVESIVIKKADIVAKNGQYPTLTMGIDTIFIKMQQVGYSANRFSSMGNIMADLTHLREHHPIELPLYIVDNQEVDIEKLKQFKTKDLEVVAVLNSCDGMQKYGKKAEFGAVIYRTKLPKTD